MSLFLRKSSSLRPIQPYCLPGNLPILFSSSFQCHSAKKVTSNPQVVDVSGSKRSINNYKGIINKRSSSSSGGRVGWRSSLGLLLMGSQKRYFIDDLAVKERQHHQEHHQNTQLLNKYHDDGGEYYSYLEEDSGRAFKLSQKFVDGFKNKKPPFGFNGLGEIVYYRTYSRRIFDDQVNEWRKEKWYETVERVVNGCFNMQKKWIEEHKLGWNPWKAQKSAQDMYARIFEMKFLPPGRGLWAMGSPITETKGLFAALNNCAFVSTKSMKEDPSKPFLFLMDMSMLGVGVGFDTKGQDSITIQSPKVGSTPHLYQIADSREGWVESVKLLLDSYFLAKPSVDFDYSKIRPAGEPIRGFGGISSGPDCLRQLHVDLRRILDKNAGSPITVTTIVDIMNCIGKCVVSGNIRRCLPASAMVHCQDGMMSIEKVKVGQQVLTADGYKRVVRWFDQGKQELVKIITEDGDFLCTRNHKVSVVSRAGQYKWVAAGDLKPGDKMLTTRVSIDGTHSQIPENINSASLSQITIPELDADISWFIGLYQAKCSMSESGESFNSHDALKFNQNELDIALKVKRQLSRFGSNLNISLDEIDNGNSYSINYSSDQLKIYLLTLLKHKDVGIRVPKWIFDSSVLNRKAYIAGIIDAHGNSALPSFKVISHTHEGFARDLQLILYSCGIESRLSVSTTNLQFSNHAPHKDLYDIQLVTSYSIGQISVIPQLNCREKLKAMMIHKNQSNIERDEQNGDRGVPGAVDLEINAHPVQVLGVEVTQRIEHTYDIEVEDNHQFFCNGYLVHNSAEIAFGEHNDEEFIDLKNYQKNPERMSWGWTSNNSIFAKLGMSYDSVSERVKVNGEPGFAWLDNMKRYSRINDQGDYKDHRACGGNPCLEQTLESFELCCLVETFPCNHESIEDYIKTLKMAYLYAKTVTLGKTHWAESNRVMLRNRRIGCSMSGIAQFITKMTTDKESGLEVLRQWCEAGYQSIQKYDMKFSDWLAIPKSIKTTSIKPSGTVSLLAGATPGMHFPESRFYLRRLRLSKDSELCTALIQAGYKVEPAEEDKEGKTLVVEFPVDSGQGIRTVQEVSLWEQLSLAAFMQKYWADNQVSCTVTFNPSTEGDQIKHALNYFQYQLKGVSLLPRFETGSTAYKQMPYEAISQETYEKMVSLLGTLNLFELKEDSVPDKYCDSDSCKL